MPTRSTKIRYSISLASTQVGKFEDFLTDSAKKEAQKIPLRTSLSFNAVLYYKPTVANRPKWANKLDNYFNIDGRIKSQSASAVLFFESSKRILACCFGFGHTFLKPELRENDFGLLVAANSLSDDSVQQVEKANLGSVIRDFTQAAGVTNIRDFNVDGALNLIRKLNGKSKDNSSIQGGAAVTVFSDFDYDELDKLGDYLINLYNSTAFKKTSFAVIEKIKPIKDPVLEQTLNQALITNISSTNPSFELGYPEIDSQPYDYFRISGDNSRKDFPDISLRILLAEIGIPKSFSDLMQYSIRAFGIDNEKRKIWSVFRGLVGSLDIGKKRYALNEGQWYSIEDSLSIAANGAFSKASIGLDINFLPWPIIGIIDKDGKNKISYEREGDYNERVASDAPDQYICYDRKLFRIPGNSGPGIEICDLFDFKNCRLVHVKRSGRKSSVISHFLNQGLNSVKILKSYPAVKDAFFADLKRKLSPKDYSRVEAAYPDQWDVEFRFGDRPIGNGRQYTIPFFSRITFEEVNREIVARGFKSSIISFIRLSNP